MARLKITLWCVLLACMYGIVHDQITARVCLSYFTEFHPPIGVGDDPTIIALCWGVLATWWVGAILGYSLALACTLGNRPRLTIREVRKPLAFLFAAMAVGAIMSGLIGYRDGAAIAKFMYPPVANLPPNLQAGFAADLFAHNVSYAVGFFGAIVVVGWAWEKRKSLPA